MRQTRYEYFWIDLIQLQKIILNLSKKGHILTTFLDFYPGKSWNNSLILIPSCLAVFQLFETSFTDMPTKLTCSNVQKNMVFGLFLGQKSVFCDFTRGNSE